MGEMYVAANLIRKLQQAYFEGSVRSAVYRSLVFQSMGHRALER